jgi:hypothetical protein
MRFGAFLRKTLGRQVADGQAVRLIKSWAGTALASAADTVFAVNEIACTDPSCPGVETVILIMEPGQKTRACKIPKALDQVTEQDVRDALEPKAWP